MQETIYNLSVVGRESCRDYATKVDASSIKVTRAFCDGFKLKDDEEAALTTFQLWALRHVVGGANQPVATYMHQVFASSICVYFAHPPIPSFLFGVFGFCIIRAWDCIKWCYEWHQVSREPYSLVIDHVKPTWFRECLTVESTRNQNWDNHQMMAAVFSDPSAKNFTFSFPKCTVHLDRSGLGISPSD